MHLLSFPVRFVMLVLFIVYMAMLTKNILFKKSPGYYKNYFKKEYRYYSAKQGWEKANTKPFSTIKLFYNSRRLNPEYKQNNLWGNFLGFVPLGLLLPLLRNYFRNGLNTFLAGFLLSLCFELCQLIFGLGIFDVDDLILNTAGCFAGFVICFIVIKNFKGMKLL